VGRVCHGCGVGERRGGAVDGRAGAVSGGVATGEVSAQPLSLSLSDAMSRGLQYNLGVLAQEQGVRDARAHAGAH